MNAVVDISEIENTAEQMCEYFCYFRVTYHDQEVLDLHCEECPMDKLLKKCREYPLGRNDWQE